MRGFRPLLRSAVMSFESFASCSARFCSTIIRPPPTVRQASAFLVLSFVVNLGQMYSMRRVWLCFYLEVLIVLAEYVSILIDVVESALASTFRRTAHVVLRQDKTIVNA